MNKKIFFLILIIGAVFQYACRKDNSGGSGTPVIKSIRAIDSTKRDSFFTEACSWYPDCNTG